MSGYNPYAGWTPEQIQQWQQYYGQPQLSQSQPPSSMVPGMSQSTAYPPYQTGYTPLSIPLNSMSFVTENVYETCPSDKKAKAEEKLKGLIKDLQGKNAIWNTDWDAMPLPESVLGFLFCIIVLKFYLFLEIKN